MSLLEMGGSKNKTEAMVVAPKDIVETRPSAVCRGTLSRSVEQNNVTDERADKQTGQSKLDLL